MSARTTGPAQWANLADQPVTATNRLEVSGTAMMIYMMLKGVRKGWLNKSYREPAIKAFNAILTYSHG